MSKPELDIIRSPEAAAFLRSVTKGFYSQSFTGLWIYEVIGREWDGLREWSEGMRTEIHPQTCTWSIAVWEWVYGFEPDESMSLEERRRRVLSRIFSAKPVNPEVLRRGISATAGAEAEVIDFTAPYSFGVTLHITGGPIPMERVLRFIYETKPAHLSVNITVVFPPIKSTLHMGGTTGSHTVIHVPCAPDRYSFHDALHLGGGMGAGVEVGVPLEPDAYAFRDTLYVGGSFGVEASAGTAAAPDSFQFQAALHTGGTAAAQAALPVPEDTAQPAATTILRTGGVCTIISNLSGRE